MIRVGVIGYGYWGPNLVRNLAETPGAELTAVCDGREERLQLARKRYPGIETYADPAGLIGDPDLDAVMIATPVSTHYEFALAALRAGKHVLVEKPMTRRASEAGHLIAEAAARGLTLMVDHTFIYTGAVRKIKELIDNGSLGQMYYYDSVRVNLGLFQHDVNVIWDLAVHDLSIMDYLLPARPEAVSATGIGHVAGSAENLAYMTFFFPGNTLAHIHVNWLAPVKVRQTLIGGSRKMIVYDDIEPSEKVKVYDKGITVGDTPDVLYQQRIGYRSGDLWVPQLDMREALALEMREFVAAVEEKRKPLSDGESGLRVVRLLEAATVSMRERGRLVGVEPGGIEHGCGGQHDSILRLERAISDDTGGSGARDSQSDRLVPVRAGKRG